MNDYSDPIVMAFNLCALNVVSTTARADQPHADKVQNFSGRPRLSSVLWTFKVDKADGVVDAPTASFEPSTSSYSFDDVSTMAGTHTILHGSVCGLRTGDDQDSRSRWR